MTLPHGGPGDHSGATWTNLDTHAQTVIRSLRQQGWDDELIARIFDYRNQRRAALAYLAHLDDSATD